MAFVLPDAEFCWFCRYLAGEADCAFIDRNNRVHEKDFKPAPWKSQLQVADAIRAAL